MDDILSAVKEYILTEFLPGEDPAALKPDTALVSSGVLDSLSTVRLIVPA
jgi:acyl carrier protein